MSDYPMLISNKLHSFRNFLMQNYNYFFSRGMLSGFLYIRTPGLTGGASALSGPAWVLREKSPGLCKEGAAP